MLFLLEATINNPSMDKNIIRIINEQGDRQKLLTNVKAQMTEWNILNENGFKELGDIVKNLSIQASEIKYNRKIVPFITCIWGAKYKSLDYAISHDHFPATWSCVYYINPPKNAPGLYFPEENKEIEIYHGKLIMFEGNVLHEVKKQEFDGFRYVVAANINDISFSTCGCNSSSAA
jgi:hypothetical protein